MQLDFTRFCNEKLWLMRSRDLPFHRRFLLTTDRVIVLTARRFVQNNCTLKASALTFYTLFSIVPILALIFAMVGFLTRPASSSIATMADAPLP